MEDRKQQYNETLERQDLGDDRAPARSKTSRRLRWIAVAVAIVFLILLLREALDPFGDQPYIEITHGDHVHYVPRDRDPDVPIGRFPTREPGPEERITPDGRIVSIRSAAPPDSAGR